MNVSNFPIWFVICLILVLVVGMESGTGYSVIKSQAPNVLGVYDNYYDIEDKMEEIESWKAVNRVSPEWIEPEIRLSWLYWSIGYKSKAEKHLNRAKNLNAENEQVQKLSEVLKKK